MNDLTQMRVKRTGGTPNGGAAVTLSVASSAPAPICSACKDFVSGHYADGCSVPDCACTRSFGSRITFAETNIGANL